MSLQASKDNVYAPTSGRSPAKRLGLTQRNTCSRPVLKWSASVAAELGPSGLGLQERYDGFLAQFEVAITISATTARKHNSKGNSSRPFGATSKGEQAPTAQHNAQRSGNPRFSTHFSDQKMGRKPNPVFLDTAFTPPRGSPVWLEAQLRGGIET